MNNKQLVSVHKQFFNELVSLIAYMCTRDHRPIMERHPNLGSHINGLLIQYISSVYKNHNIDKPIRFALYLWKTKNITYHTDRLLDTSSILDHPFVKNYCKTHMSINDYNTLRKVISSYEEIFERVVGGWAAKCKSAGMPAVVDGFEFFMRDMDELLGEIKILQSCS